MRERPPLDRLPFTLPDFTRTAWVSERARQTWEPRLARITEAWAEIEWRAVVAGVRACSVAIRSPEGFLDDAPRWAEAGLSALPVEMTGVSGQPYSATGVPVRPGEPFAFRLVVGRPGDVSAFKQAWDAADQEGIGDLLGYPSCCREFFRRVWVDDEMVDTTWPMACNTARAAGDDATLEVTGPPQSNILWRWMGVRAVPHLPCRFDCDATVALADALCDVGRHCGYAEEVDWLEEVLSWPAEWSALHGIAEIKTPILKTTTRTDATTRRYVVRRQGDRRPDEALPGLGFAYETPVRVELGPSRGVRRGLDHARTRGAEKPSWYATDNGFPSVEAMEHAHRPIVETALTYLTSGGDVLDLGCGNGALLAALCASSEAIRPHGIDLDAMRIDHARVLHPDHVDDFVVGDLIDDERLWARDRYALALVMPGRLLEASPGRVSRLRRRLTGQCARVLLYAYGDWLERPGGLDALARASGFVVVEPIRVVESTVAVALGRAERNGIERSDHLPSVGAAPR